MLNGHIKPTHGIKNYEFVSQLLYVLYRKLSLTVDLEIVENPLES